MQQRRKKLLLSALWAIGWTGAAARGHDLWLLPGESTALGKPGVVLVNQGMEFPVSEAAADLSTAELMLIQPDGASGKLTPSGKAKTSSILSFLPDQAGLYIAAVKTTPKVLTLGAEEFNTYLVSDGMPHVYLRRAESKTLGEPSRERYSKSPKALIRVGEGGSGDATKPIGLPLEIVPLRDPFALKVGDTLAVRVLFNGQPLADGYLGWDYPNDGPAFSGTVRTNDQGEALVPIGRTGLFTIRITHMTQPKTTEYEWESFWTSLTLRLPTSKDQP